MSAKSASSPPPLLIFLLLPLLLLRSSAAVSPDGLTLLALKSEIASDPTYALAEWRETDPDPCHWPGVACANFSGFPSPRVVALTLANRNLSGRIAPEIGRLAFLRRLNLHGNRFYGEIPPSLSNSTSLHSLFLYNNNLSGPIPAASLCSLPRLQNVDLSSNALSGGIPDALRDCGQLQRLLLAGNRLSGVVPAGLFPDLSNLLQLDLSSNEFSGAIPADLGDLHALSSLLNLSNNHFSGEIPTSLGDLPPYVTIDLRNNELSGEVPQIPALSARGGEFLLGNPGLCGYPLAIACRSPRSVSAPPVPAAGRSRKLSVWVIAAISAADAVGVAAVGLALVLVYWKMKERGRRGGEAGFEEEEEGSCCGCGGGGKACTKGLLWCGKEREGQWEGEEEEEGGGEKGGADGKLVAVDGAFGVGLEELLRASAYVLGKGARGIVYKVVVGGGISVAVRRLEGGGTVSGAGGGGSGYKEFKAEAEAIGKVRHPNVVRMRAYYWAQDEKLIVSDFVPGGSLALALKACRQGQPALSWPLRLRIIKGVAQGLSYLHECSPRKFVHGEVKPSNILLDADFTPSISDFGLTRLLSIATSDIPSSSSSSSYTTLGLPITKHSSSLRDRPNNYRAPEACLPCCSRPSQKWDVYSFGMVVLQLLTGKSPDQMEAGELVRWVRKGFDMEKPLDSMVDGSLLLEVQSKKVVVEVFRLALSCLEIDPDSRPRMKAVVECLEKIGS